GLDIIGERWGLLVVRELLLGPKRFTDLAEGLPGIGTNVLTARLRELEENGVIAKHVSKTPPRVTVYELTAHGRELEPIFLALARWGAPALATLTGDEPLRASWLGLAFKAFFDPEAARGLTATLELEMPSGVLAVSVEDGALSVREGEAQHPD